MKIKDAMRSEETKKHGVLGVVLDLLSIQNQRLSSLEQGIDTRMSNLDKRLCFKKDAINKTALFSANPHIRWTTCSKTKRTVRIRVFHKNTFSKEKIVHTLMTPYRAYINHNQKISFLGQV